MKDKVVIMLAVLLWALATWPEALLWWLVTHDWVGAITLLFFPLPIPLVYKRKE